MLTASHSPSIVMAKRGRRRSNKNRSWLEAALQRDWQYSAWLGAASLVGVFIVSKELGHNPVTASMAALLTPLGYLMSTAFGGIALFKYVATRRKPMTGLSVPALSPSCDQHRNRSPSQLDQAWQARDDASATPPGSVPPVRWSPELLRELDWKRFEELVVAYFQAKGQDCRLNSGGADGGIDATLYKDGKPVALVQCKSWANRDVGVKTVRELRGVMAHEHVGVAYIMATGEFSNEAKVFAKQNAILLVPGRNLVGAIGKLSAEQQDQLLTLATSGDYTTPSCPTCLVKLTRRTGSRGDFWGCRNFPRCRTVISARAS